MKSGKTEVAYINLSDIYASQARENYSTVSFSLLKI